ncbi:MAG: glycoside hydrolase family 25 protein [Candidatus Coprovivens sp.]
MKKRILLSTLIICLAIIGVLSYYVFIPMYKNYQNEKEIEKELERIKNAKVIVELMDERNIPFLSKDIHASYFIDEINGELIEDVLINTETVGEQDVSFEYINEEGIKIPYSFKVNIIDTVAPSIWLNQTYTVYTGYQGNIAKDITCADDIDDHPTCEIIGEYDTNIPGNYKLQYQAIDSSGNKNVKDFTLIVKNKSQVQSNNSQQVYSYTNFNEVIEKYKNENTKIGIDVSGWQGEIDFQAVKEAGVEFVFIKVGGTKGIDGDYYVDSKFIRNIEGFNNVGIPVGIYIYSYVKDAEDAIRDANWVLEQIKPYNVELPVVYDWENWSFYNEFEHSFYTLTKNAKTFLDIMSSNGYKGALYSSKNYLEKAWMNTGYEVWLAHYTEKTNYQGEYTYWQLCDNGKIDGVNGAVDIDIMYINK